MLSDPRSPTPPLQLSSSPGNSIDGGFVDDNDGDDQNTKYHSSCHVPRVVDNSKQISACADGHFVANASDRHYCNSSVPPTPAAGAAAVIGGSTLLPSSFSVSQTSAGAQPSAWQTQWQTWTDGGELGHRPYGVAGGSTVTNVAAGAAVGARQQQQQQQQECFLCRGEQLKYLRLADLPQDVRAAIKSVNYSNLHHLEGSLKQLALIRVEHEPWRRDIEYNKIINLIQSKCISFKMFRKRVGLGKY